LTFVHCASISNLYSVVETVALIQYLLVLSLFMSIGAGLV
jgi:hypothetical protein